MRNLIRALIAALSLTAVPVISQAGLFIGVSVGLPPPALPVYVQPPCPSPGYMWIPGYWAWDDGYYWVPGTWVLAPEPGLLWTPGYWGWSEGAYMWHAGYWGPQVGFYGGINYGFGYTGEGYEGGYWRGHEFYYNRAVTNINNTNIVNVYNRTVINNVNVTRVSFNGGAGGVSARPTPAQISAEHERHLGLTPVQREQEQMAHSNSALRAAVNGGHPPIAATPRPGNFSGRGVVAARGAEGAAALSERDREHISGAAHVNGSAPAEQKPPSRMPQYVARSSEHSGTTNPPYPGHEGHAPYGGRAPYEGHVSQPHPMPQALPEPRVGSTTPPAAHYPVRQGPQYQPQPPQPQHEAPRYAQPQHAPPQYVPPQRPQPQHAPPQVSSQAPRPAPPQGPVHGGQAPQGHGQQAARPEHGGEHNRQG